MTQKQIILNLLRDKNDWIPSYLLEKVDTKWGWLGTSGLKRCRELEVGGRIYKTYKEGYVWYRAEPPVNTIVYKVNGEPIYTKKVYA